MIGGMERAQRHGPVLPIDRYDAAIFDLDGVVTRTARVHAASWKKLFDAYLRDRARRTGERYRPFDMEADYLRYVDGKPRYDGVASFLESRGITLARGELSDPPERETVCGLGNRKNVYFLESLRTGGVEVFESTVALVRELRERGLGTALVSSSRNARAVLRAAGLEGLFDACIDGDEAERRGLRGKPRPDIFVAAAKDLGVEPERAIAFEDALSGVEAGRAGGFGLTVGIDRSGQAQELREKGADLVVNDLSELRLQPGAPTSGRGAGTLPDALDRTGEIERAADGKRVAVFLDYDGTLTPIVARPDLAVLSAGMRETVKDLARLCAVAIISGRDRGDVERLVCLKELFYAGSHGFDIAGPRGFQIQHQEGAAVADAVAHAAAHLREAAAAIQGALVEPKRFAVAVHYRQVAEGDVPALEALVDEALANFPDLHKTFGKKVFELRPRLDWDKGKAVLWVLEALGLEGPDVLPFYIGDDLTDEDAFRALAARGIGILVGRAEGETAARYVLDGPPDVKRFLERLTALLRKRDS